MGRPTKENSLSRQDVINAAVECIDQEGASALGVSRVARRLGIKPPAIYRHLENGTHLQQATAIEIWQRYLSDCEQTLAGKDITLSLLKQLGFFIRDFAKSYPGRYQVMMHVQLQPNDPDAATVINRSLDFLRQALCAYDLTETQLIDVMRMLNAAIYGFISVEQSGLMTLERPADQSYGVMLEALIAAVKYVEGQ
ncbi:Tetracycline repressor protein class D [Acaryochloris thomasi RCC1774]|uniref:Tetracycline repressor protein class D n=1 Tax=Acaryochloris thomasi RCC1774 TaxID=1764569 RepID=A0A2W1JR55_9CYAN|nr:TetR/AcrR family transcriptional regulator [Acaryochloris thomasi]PZD73312.1 Tetracycline repressor protein class D [Acaryochloris thomasi RCC1774]